MGRIGQQQLTMVTLVGCCRQGIFPQGRTCIVCDMGDDDRDMFEDEPEEAATANGTSGDIPVDLRHSYRRLLDRISLNRDEIEEAAGEMQDDMDQVVEETMDEVRSTTLIVVLHCTRMHRALLHSYRICSLG
jgi:hypothetical protein